MDMNYLKYVGAAVGVIVLVFVLMPSQAAVDVENIKAADQSLGPPVVTATLKTSGPAITVSYWVETGRSGNRLCQGSVRLDAKSRKDLSFRCPDLVGHAGAFTLRTGPAS